MSIDMYSERMIRAVDFAARAHSTQRRHDVAKTPYINHPIGVAAILVRVARLLGNERQVSDVLVAAVLHDVVEDTIVTVGDVRAEFGNDVAAIVASVTDNTSLPKAARKQLQLEHIAVASTAAKLVKLADMLYNLRDLQREMPVGWTIERVQGYFAWKHTMLEAARGTDEALEEALDYVFAGTFSAYDDETVALPCLVPEDERAALIERWYAAM